MTAGPDLEVAPRAGRTKVGPGRTHPAPVVGGALNVGDAFLARAVVVGVARDPQPDRTLDEGLAQRIAPVEIGHRNGPVASAVCVVTGPEPALAAAEIRQHVGIAPAGIAALGPAVEIHPLATVVDMAVDRARSAERLAAGRRNDPAAGPVARFGLVEPVDPRVDQGPHETGRDVDEQVPVRRSGLEQAHARPRLGGETVGQHASRRARTDDHVVEGIGHPSLPLQPRGAQSRARILPWHGPPMVAESPSRRRRKTVARAPGAV